MVAPVRNPSTGRANPQRAGAVVSPLGHGRFEARLGERVILGSSRQPLLDAARVLLAEGADPGARIQMRHAGAIHVALSSTVGKAAKLEVKEDTDGPRFVPFYDRQQTRRNDSPVRFDEEAVPSQPSAPDALYGTPPA